MLMMTTNPCFRRFVSFFAFRCARVLVSLCFALCADTTFYDCSLFWQHTTLLLLILPHLRPVPEPVADWPASCPCPSCPHSEKERR